MKLEKKSPAKINIFLQVPFKRDDGYHEVNSLMVPVSLFDIITITISEGSGIKCSVKEGGVDSKLQSDIQIPMNIATEAAKLYLEKAQSRPEIGEHLVHDISGYCIDIEIEKNIPIGAGLGGGSSNGATVLLMLEEMLKAGFSETELMEMAGELGSDVPFFIPCKAAVVTGRGEILNPVDFPKSHFILINPLVNVSTALVYKNLDLTKNHKNNTLTYSGKSADVVDYLAELLYNDLEEGVIDEHPIIGELKLGLRGQGALGSLMSGSGSTVFGIFSDKEMAKEALKFLTVKYRNCLVYQVESIG